MEDYKQEQTDSVVQSEPRVIKRRETKAQRQSRIAREYNILDQWFEGIEISDEEEVPAMSLRQISELLEIPISKSLRDYMEMKVGDGTLRFQKKNPHRHKYVFQ